MVNYNAKYICYKIAVDHASQISKTTWQPVSGTDISKFMRPEMPFRSSFCIVRNGGFGGENILL